MSLEIERKWLVPDFPTKLKLKEIWDVWQSYLYVNDEVEIRISRKCKHPDTDIYHHKQVIKLGNGLVRPEFSLDLSERDYKQYAENIKQRPITKLYHIYDFLGYNLEVSLVDEKWMYAEIEFPNEEEANNFIIPYPDWNEVTGIPEYQMKNYWLQRQNPLN